MVILLHSHVVIGACGNRYGGRAGSVLNTVILEQPEMAVRLRSGLIRNAVRKKYNTLEIFP